MPCSLGPGLVTTLSAFALRNFISVVLILNLDYLQTVIDFHIWNHSCSSLSFCLVFRLSYFFFSQFSTFFSLFTFGPGKDLKSVYGRQVKKWALCQVGWIFFFFLFLILDACRCWFFKSVNHYSMWKKVVGNWLFGTKNTYRPKCKVKGIKEN